MNGPALCQQCKKSNVGIQGGRCVNCRAASWQKPDNNSQMQPINKPHKNYNNHQGGQNQGGHKAADPNAICKHFL